MFINRFYFILHCKYSLYSYMKKTVVLFMLLAAPTNCLPSDVLSFSQGDFSHVMNLEGIPQEELSQTINIILASMKKFDPYSAVTLEQAREMVNAVPHSVKPALQEALAALLGVGAGTNILNVPNLKVSWIVPLQAAVEKSLIPASPKKIAP